ncbi:EXPORTIN 1, ARABIDOPSIS THALIANA EXPORTIN 1, exportin 1A, HEAT-INTOLERANT 2 [Hibiscus trionum]|uniref:EXPORTIN 1, ARABIDOPSIS THALIANA EXPORTIN 1, exportin 1A, HEAT-INTOLERANT 2 n=1 Tax=Hibiscus trionum TaxID=183268 RepID=A0A9W7M0P9_HIBTR|nr:EXPORTIN 1, ARABIDOPSIS THALIANA EXPORTIN 1, exportin 1A, HEAT-INTOLERANT 2 [Hibiscus trionum]
MAAERLKDLSQPIDVPLLDATVGSFYGTGSKEERAQADQILRHLQNNPDMWLQVVHILQQTKSLNTKFFALQVLEGVIKYRWNALPVEQRDGMKNYISEVIVQLSSNEASFRAERLYVNKLNGSVGVHLSALFVIYLFICQWQKYNTKSIILTLLMVTLPVLKHDLPARWQSFIPDLVAAAKTSETICENCMAILKLLSEEVFDFSRGEMTQQKIKELKQSLNSEFQLIHELCLYVLSASQRTELIRATLSTLHAFLSWIPLGYIFESTLLETLLKLFPVPLYRNLTLQCLTKMITKFFEDYPEHRLKFFSLLRAIATHCFPALIQLSSEQLKLVMDSIIWAFRHTERNIAEISLNLLLEMLKRFVTQFVNGLFESRNDLSTFKNHMRDFLVQLKEFSAQDNKDLYAEEAAVQRERERQRMLSIPGLIPPNEVQDEMLDS